MQVFWNLERAFIREVIPNLNDPKSHYNSVATIVKILEHKGFLAHETVGNINCYHPLITREEYQKYAMKDIVTQYFNNSYPRMLAFFAKEQNLTDKDLKELMEIVKNKGK